MSDLGRMGRRLAGIQDRRLARLHVKEAPPSSALGEHLLRRANERRRVRRTAWLSLAAVVVVGVSLGLRLLPGRKQGGPATVRVQAGQRIEASRLDLALAFDDGSSVVLSRGASLRTDSVGPASADLELEHGRATAHVVHTLATRWQVRAGAYTILVTGTRFRLEWRPESGAFSVGVDEGSVRVSGGLLVTPLEIGTGQALTLENGDLAGSRTASTGRAGGHPVGHAATAASHPGLPVPAPSAQKPIHQRVATASFGGPSGEPPSEAEPSAFDPIAPSSRKVAGRTSVASWLQQAEAGRYRDAVDEAERKGLEGICRQATAADLLLLAEAARYAGRTQRAEQVLKAIRGRFARGEDPAVAAYLLGRIAVENRHNHGEAARWFRAYLDEWPGGRLEREAKGRLIESLAFVDRDKAREEARGYLGRYPSGPHASFARDLLGL